METKTCSKCGIEKPINDFYKRSRSEGKYRADCKICNNEMSKKYYKDNSEKIAERHKEWRIENPGYREEYRKTNKEKILESDRKYYLNNKEKISQYKKEWNKANPKKDIAYSKKHYKNNKEYYKEKNKQWRKENPGKIREYRQKQRGLKQKLAHNLPASKWNEIMLDFDCKCAYCGISEEEHLEKHKQTLSQEHFIPLSKGGEYTHNNIIPSCRSCNNSKRSKDFFEWYPTYKHYNKNREQFILEYLNYTNENIQQLALF